MKQKIEKTNEAEFFEALKDLIKISYVEQKYESVVHKTMKINRRSIDFGPKGKMYTEKLVTKSIDLEVHEWNLTDKRLPEAFVEFCLKAIEQQISVTKFNLSMKFNIFIKIGDVVVEYPKVLKKLASLLIGIATTTVSKEQVVDEIKETIDLTDIRIKRLLLDGDEDVIAAIKQLYPEEPDYDELTETHPGIQVTMSKDQLKKIKIKHNKTEKID